MTSQCTMIDLVRHGEPEGGPMFRGHTDHPLSDTGWQQMHRAIRSQDQWDAVITSPLQRCADFAEAIADRRTEANSKTLPVHYEPRLKEIGFGEWEGQTTDVVMDRWGAALGRFWDDPANNPPPGGEPLAQFQARVIDGWQHWCRELAGKRVLMVCHGGSIRMILAHVMGIPLTASFRGIAVPYGCRSRVRLDVSEHGTLACLMSHGSP